MCFRCALHIHWHVHTFKPLKCIEDWNETFSVCYCFEDATSSCTKVSNNIFFLFSEWRFRITVWSTAPNFSFRVKWMRTRRQVFSRLASAESQSEWWGRNIYRDNEITWKCIMAIRIWQNSFFLQQPPLKFPKMLKFIKLNSKLKNVTNLQKEKTLKGCLNKSSLNN